MGAEYLEESTSGWSKLNGGGAGVEWRPLQGISPWEEKDGSLRTRNEVTMKTILADYVCLSVPKLRPPENDNQAQLITRCVNFSEKDE